MLAERPSRAGKLVGGISSDGLYTRPSCKGHEEVQLPLEETRKPGALPQIVGNDTEVSSNANVVPEQDTSQELCTHAHQMWHPIKLFQHITSSPKWTSLMRCSLLATRMLCLSSGVSYAPAPCSLRHDML